MSELLTCNYTNFEMAGSFSTTKKKYDFGMMATCFNIAFKYFLLPGSFKAKPYTPIKKSLYKTTELTPRKKQTKQQPAMLEISLDYNNE